MGIDGNCFFMGGVKGSKTTDPIIDDTCICDGGGGSDGGSNGRAEWADGEDTLDAAGGWS